MKKNMVIGKNELHIFRGLYERNRSLWPWHFLGKGHNIHPLAIAALFCPEAVINDYQKAEETNSKFYLFANSKVLSSWEISSF